MEARTRLRTPGTAMPAKAKENAMVTGFWLDGMEMIEPAVRVCSWIRDNLTTSATPNGADDPRARRAGPEVELRRLLGVQLRRSVSLRDASQ